MPSAAFPPHPVRIGALLLAIASIVWPALRTAGAAPPSAGSTEGARSAAAERIANRAEIPEAARLREWSERSARSRSAAAARAELDTRARETLRSLSARIRSLPDGPERAALLVEMSGVLRSHRIARLRLEVDLARSRGDLAGVERIGQVLERFEHPRSSAPQPGVARDRAREGAGR